MLSVTYTTLHCHNMSSTSVNANQVRDAMDFRLTSAQEQFRESVRRMAEKHFAQDARNRAHSPEYPWDVAKVMAAHGLLGITISEADGGHRRTLIDPVIAIEPVASACPTSAPTSHPPNFHP